MEDYFAGSAGSAPRPQPAQPSWGTPVDPAQQPYAGQQPYSDQQPYAAPQSYPGQAYPGQQGAPAAWGPSYQQAAPGSYPYVPAQQGTSVLAKVAIGVGVGFGALVVLGILAAVAIPVFLNQRAKDVAARTTVSIPQSIAGLPHLTDARGAAMEQRLSSIPAPGSPHLAGAFGTPGETVVVGVTKYPMSIVDQQGYLRGAERGLENDVPTPVSFSDAPAGSLGGTLRCGTLPNGALTCFFVDGGAYGTVIVVGAGDAGTALALQAREAVEHRA